MISRKITDKINVDAEGDYRRRCGIDDKILMMKGLDFKEYIFDEQECHKIRKVKVKVKDKLECQINESQKFFVIMVEVEW